MTLHALHAIGELERKAAALLRASLRNAQELSCRRRGLIALVAGERHALLTVGPHESFQYHVLTARTLWSATLASVLAESHKRELSGAAAARAERLHWAACRRGLERRAARRGAPTWRG